MSQIAPDILKKENLNLLEKEILACIPCGLVVLNTRGIIVWSNKAAQDLLGCGLQGSLWLDVIQRAFSPRADDGHEVSLADGRRVNVAISSLSGMPGQLVTLIDLTTTRDYEQAKAKQGRLMMIGRMTAQLAHQIRTPLSSAMLFTDHLIHQQTNDSRSIQWLSRLRDCHVSIEQQIEDLLLFARGEALELVATDLKAWSERLLERIYPLVEEAAVAMDVDNQLPSMYCNLHSESLTGAVLNLINNALDAGAACIDLKMYAKTDGSVSLQVIDNGEGLSEEVKNQVFTPFFTTKAQGTGLGLAVVHAVVKAHGGEVILESSPGKGCCVTINLSG
ncbi:sensor histidine kinase [Legionella spiritensis]|uniref:histidine kinase n=1 Tax=Legionella spiritensis TaxID=452 RepID=A0A0W0Z9H9_LEGSP|nr:HAMP domain-containing sensor histidine kinase [Legionella spiritensis]KTD65776.1 sensor kinase HydH [Legionella spiritensis]SNV41407.1 sensor kinase HydH [Legionella spiritensis]VEG90569.1 sensor kinase HydH [Legionella spiritensis]